MYDQRDVVELGRNLAPYYYAFIIRGIVLIGFGICFLFFPVASWVSFSFIFGSLALADAVFNISKACILGCSAGVENKYQVMTMFLLSALCTAGIGIVAIIYPAATAEAFLLILALWLIYIGMAQLWLACLMASESESSNSCCLGLVAMIYLVTGFTILLDLQGNIGFFILFVGFSLVMFGMQMILMGINLRKVYKSEYSPMADANVSMVV
jgi:uncharacterized membrane protein HdeD (DUF308 family)